MSNCGIIKCDLVDVDDFRVQFLRDYLAASMLAHSRVAGDHKLQLQSMAHHSIFVLRCYVYPWANQSEMYADLRVMRQRILLLTQLSFFQYCLQ
jgi:hypothetical protein